MSKIILCGFNWAGCKALSLIRNMYDDVFVYTHESPPYVNSLYRYADKVGIDCTKEKISLGNLPFAPDIILSMYYRKIIKKEVLKKSKIANINLHPSLLPKYRGCSSLTWAMVDGKEHAGFTYHYMTEDVDSGRIIFQKPIKIEKFDTQETLYNRAMFESLKELEHVLELAEEGFKGHEQDENEATYKSRGAPYGGCIKEEWEIDKKERFVRAMTYPPRPYAKLDGEEIKTIEDLSVE